MDLKPSSSNETLQLTSIDLCRNKIRNVSGSNFPPNLESSDLNHNQINNISISKNNVRYLNQINLAKNNLSILPQTDLDAIFNLRDNPIACNCQNSWLFQKSKTNDAIAQSCKLVNKFNPDNQTTLSVNVLCESNYKNNCSLTTSPVSEYNTSHCTDQQTTSQPTTIDNTWSIVIGITGPLCVFAIVYGVIHCVKSGASAKRVKRIQQTYRLMQNAGTAIETNGKVFDVFISYSNEDSEFVATEIVPQLSKTLITCVSMREILWVVVQLKTQ
ncbi:hypothetical protein CHUAL_009190 [Chamberlinius hualienensis]